MFKLFVGLAFGYVFNEQIGVLIDKLFPEIPIDD